MSREQRFLYLLVFVVGMASLGAEIAAARLMAPFFGASTIIWANTIAVVLVALSIGYWLGGRLGRPHPRPPRAVHDRGRPRRSCSPLVPFVARPFFSVSVGRARRDLGRRLRRLAVRRARAGRGARCSCSARARPGRSGCRCGRRALRAQVAGRLYAISTAGSLVGTCLAALVLIPFVGTQRTFLVFALALALVAAAGLGWRCLLVPACSSPR